MLNILRQQHKVQSALALASSRRLASTFVPPASLQPEHFDRRPPRIPPPKAKPASPTFYTGRASYYDQLDTLEDAVNHTRQALKTLQLLPLPRFARDALPPLQPAWISKESLSEALVSRLTTSRYRRFTNVLNELNDHRRIADTAGCMDLSTRISELLKIFELDGKEAVLVRGQRKPIKIDEFGRSYAVGKRKESAARVWVIPVQTPQAPESKAAIGETEDLLPATLDPSAKPIEIPTTNILINNTPLSQYFPVPADRERIIRPLKIAGLLGAYNVFALVRGGGTTGQSGAVSLGLAKGLAAHVPEVEEILRKAKLLRRDPRMVERKKTGMAKARKRYAWVKR